MTKGNFAYNDPKPYFNLFRHNLGVIPGQGKIGKKGKREEKWRKKTIVSNGPKQIYVA